MVTFEEFVSYYENVSCSIDDDQYFEIMMVNAWKLDGRGPVKKAERFELWENIYNL